MKNTPRQVYEAFRTSMLAKTENWMELIAEEVKLIGPLAQVEGKAKFIEINKPFFSSIKDSTVHQIIESGDYILTRISTEVILPSNKTLTLEVSEWYEIRKNLIQSLRVYFDTAEFRKEMMR